MNNNIALFLLTVLFFHSCRNTPNTTGSTGTVDHETVESVAENSSTGLVIPPEASDPGHIQIVLQAGYRDKELSDIQPMLSEDWYDFFLDEQTGKYHLKKSELIVENTYDDCLEDSVASVFSKRKASLFIKGITDKDRQLKSVTIKKNMVWVGETMTFGFNGEYYTFRGDGITEKRDSAWLGSDKPQRWDIVKDYALYFSAKGKKEQAVINIPEFDDTFVKILWIGDLDEDGKPDFILDTSPHYEYKRVSLFLSSEACGDEQVKLAGTSEYGFDC